MDASATTVIVRRIADMLGVPEHLFSDAEEITRLDQTAILVMAFQRILDPDARQMCLDFVSAVASFEDRYAG
jgi:FtsZ-interacting cell division protein YlmF